MLRSIVSLSLMCGLMVACQSQKSDSSNNELRGPAPFEDINSDPNIFEANLIAREAVLTIGGEEVTFLTYGGRVPGPEIRVKQGDRIIIHLQNDLPEDFPTTIHWHGIEGTNAMDGTLVTQLPIMPGESFTYDFIAPRPGVYWYHPHIRGGQSVHSGLYAPLIVEDPAEPTLIEEGILPKQELTLVVSDVSIWNGKIPAIDVNNAMTIMNGIEGERLLVNGQEKPTFEIAAGEGLRLRIINTSITRFYRLKVPGHSLFRIGGEGGLLDRVRLEGGTVKGRVETVEGEFVREEDVDLRFARGEIVVSPAERTDVILVPEGEVGDRLTLRWEDYARGRHGMWMEGEEMVMGDADDDGGRPGEDIAYFQLVEGSGNHYSIAEGDPILAAVGRRVGNVDMSGRVLNFTGNYKTELQGRMDMWKDQDDVWQMETVFSIDGTSWKFMKNGTNQRYAPTARHAKIGDTIRWEIKNSTSMAHPWHLHGFSFKPVEFIRHDSEREHGEEEGEGEENESSEHATVTRWSLDYDEFEDTTLIPAHTSLIYHVYLDDPNGTGGSAGRWVKHCHIFQHGEAGMMSELVVKP